MAGHDLAHVSAGNFNTEIVEPWEALLKKTTDEILLSDKIESREMRMEISLYEYCQKAFHEYFTSKQHMDEFDEILQEAANKSKMLYSTKGVTF